MMTIWWRKYEGLVTLAAGVAFAEWVTPDYSVIGKVLDVIVTSLRSIVSV